LETSLPHQLPRMHLLPSHTLMNHTVVVLVVVVREAAMVRLMLRLRMLRL